MPAAKKPRPAKSLFTALAKLGMRETYLRQIALPEWWDDEIAETPAGRDELHLMLAQMLGLDALSLRQGRPRFLPEPVSKLKAAKGLEVGTISTARHIAVQLARLVTLGVIKPGTVPPSAAVLRAAMLKSGRPWIDLDGLLDWCWDAGIPVVHVAKWPAECRRMAALVASVGRPVIVLAANLKPSAWLLFHLAHELGHVACRHVPPGEVLIDAEVDEESKDSEEIEANKFAVELLTGDARTRVVAAGRLPKAADLAAIARREGERRGIDPGHVVLNYAHSMARTFWGVANAALKQIEPQADAPALVRRKLIENMEWSKLPKTSAGFVLRAVGAENPAA